MSVATAVDAHWLADLGGVFYSVKEKGYSAVKGRREVEYSKKAELEVQIAKDRREMMEKGEDLAPGKVSSTKQPSVVKKPAKSGSSVVKPTIGRRR